MKLNENIQFNNEFTNQTSEKNIPDITKIKVANDGRKEISEVDALAFKKLQEREAQDKKHVKEFLKQMEQMEKAGQ